MVFIGLGSNMGERLNNLTSGIRLLQEKGISCLRSSSVYETQAWGFTDQAPFLNAVVSLHWMESPEALLQVLMEIEKSCGRIREIKWGPRVLDLDILMCNAVVLKTEPLQIPHPGIPQRAFVLIPWAEIAPDIRIPGYNTSPADLLATLPEADRNGVQYYSPPLF
jgi:2-amino-4-hydroxy-6-hydroxymethyldihydropteridine diphosphokinase